MSSSAAASAVQSPLNAYDAEHQRSRIDAVLQFSRTNERQLLQSKYQTTHMIMGSAAPNDDANIAKYTLYRANERFRDFVHSALRTAMESSLVMHIVKIVLKLNAHFQKKKHQIINAEIQSLFEDAELSVRKLKTAAVSNEEKLFLIYDEIYKNESAIENIAKLVELSPSAKVDLLRYDKLMYIYKNRQTWAESNVQHIRDFFLTNGSSSPPSSLSQCHENTKAFLFSFLMHYIFNASVATRKCLTYLIVADTDDKIFSANSAVLQLLFWCGANYNFHRADVAGYVHVDERFISEIHRELDTATSKEEEEDPASSSSSFTSKKIKLAERLIKTRLKRSLDGILIYSPHAALRGIDVDSASENYIVVMHALQKSMRRFLARHRGSVVFCVLSKIDNLHVSDPVINFYSDYDEDKTIFLRDALREDETLLHSVMKRNIRRRIVEKSSAAAYGNNNSVVERYLENLFAKNNVYLISKSTKAITDIRDVVATEKERNELQKLMLSFYDRDPRLSVVQRVLKLYLRKYHNIYISDDESLPLFVFDNKSKNYFVFYDDGEQ